MCFLTCSWRSLASHKLEQLYVIQIGKKILGFRNMQEKLENVRNSIRKADDRITCIKVKVFLKGYIFLKNPHFVVK